MENATSRRGRPRAWDDKTEQNTIKSLDRALQVLEHLSSKSGATLSELANDLSQSPATIYRVLVTFQRQGYVELDRETQTWNVGVRAFLVGARYLRQTSVVDRAQPVLNNLMLESGETANLAVARDGHVVFVSQVECDDPIRAFFSPGTTSPMHASGIGKALMAELPENELQAQLAQAKLERFTSRTITDPQELRAELQEIRTRGFAFDDQERNLGMRCIAAPVFDWLGMPIAGISVSGPVHRILDANTPRLAEAVIRAAKQLSGSLGAEDN